MIIAASAIGPKALRRRVVFDDLVRVCHLLAVKGITIIGRNDAHITRSRLSSSATHWRSKIGRRESLDRSLEPFGLSVAKLSSNHCLRPPDTSVPAALAAKVEVNVDRRLKSNIVDRPVGVSLVLIEVRVGDLVRREGELTSSERVSEIVLSRGELGPGSRSRD